MQPLWLIGKTNQITKLITSEDRTVTSLEELDDHIISFFKDLLIEEDQHRSIAHNQFLELLPSIITQAHNAMLTNPIIEDEVHVAV